jgi:sugar lactone lactonase YvrE
MRVLVLACALAVPAVAFARHFEEEFSPSPPFASTQRSIGGLGPARHADAYQTSSRIAAIGDGALAIDADSGKLLRTDTAGALVAQLDIGRDAGLLAFDPSAQRAYIADRRGDRIIVIDASSESAFEVAAMWRTPAEPYGVALSPDRTTVLVTAIADRVVVAYNAQTGAERWRAPLGPEPRGISISSDGVHATVASLTSGAVDEVAFDREPVKVHHAALPVTADGARARGAFAVTYLGDRMAVAAYQQEVPVAMFPQSEGHYGGGSSFTPPITHHLAFFGADGKQAAGMTSVQEPRALAWDPAVDQLYVAGLAKDVVVAIGSASQAEIGGGSIVDLGTRCGADGLAVAANGDVLVWCSFSREVARISVDDPKNPKVDAAARWVFGRVQRGPELVVSALDKQQHEGLVLFHTGDTNISAFGAMSCGNCHLDGRSDGLSWQIQGHALQTPALAGRLAGTAPFKWDGTAKDLKTSLRQTLERLGGSGLSKRHLASLDAFLTTTAPIRTPTRDAASVARGRTLFESAELGCTACHDGRSYTDRERHALPHQQAFDTPSLLGLAASAPYFHDGSAATLEAVVRDRGKIHGMSEGATKLSDADVVDLVAFLETL